MRFLELVILPLFLCLSLSDRLGRVLLGLLFGIKCGFILIESRLSIFDSLYALLGRLVDSALSIGCLSCSGTELTCRRSGALEINAYFLQKLIQYERLILFAVSIEELNQESALCDYIPKARKSIARLFYNWNIGRQPCGRLDHRSREPNNAARNSDEILN